MTMHVSEPNADGANARASGRPNAATAAMRAVRLDDGACFRRALALVVIALSVFMCGCAGEGDDTTLASTTTTLAGGAASLDAIQASIFTPSCATSGCHDAATQAGALRLTDAQTSFEDLVGVASTCAARVLVVAGDPDASYLLHKLGDGAAPCGSIMPVGAPTLGPGELQDIRDWIAEGAPPPATSLLQAGTTTSSTLEEEPR